MKANTNQKWRYNDPLCPHLLVEHHQGIHGTLQLEVVLLYVYEEFGKRERKEICYDLGQLYYNMSRRREEMGRGG